MGLQKGQMTDMQEWHHDQAKRKKAASAMAKRQAKRAAATRQAVEGRWMTEAQIKREVQKRVREKVRGVLEDVKELWIEALSDKDLFGEAKKRRKR